jgi:hypothetical protein
VTAQPARYFAFGPYKAEAIGPYEWWGVKNKNGLNVLTFADRPGHVFALEAEAKSLADEWNSGKMFEYLPEPEIKAALRLTDAQMAKYVLSQRFVDGRWVSPIVLLGGQQSADAIDAYVET